jgi:hypothetical protein
MPNFPHDQPTEATDDGDFARQLATLLGPAYQAGDDSNNAAEFLALGGALADLRLVIIDSLAEAFANEAWDLLSELETIYGLPVRTDLDEEDRQARLVAKIRAARAGTPNSILLAVSTYDTTADRRGQRSRPSDGARRIARRVSVGAADRRSGLSGSDEARSHSRAHRTDEAGAHEGDGLRDRGIPH